MALLPDATVGVPAFENQDQTLRASRHPAVFSLHIRI
jgi:hypothetical protein